MKYASRKNSINVFGALLFAAITFFMLPILVRILSPFPISTTTYPEEMTGFEFSHNPKCCFEYNSIPDGFDFNIIRIYEITSDIDEFSNHLIQNGWSPLPLSSEVLATGLCDPDFHNTINDMLRCTDGYWCWKADSKELTVFDSTNRLLYIREATVFIN